MAPLHRTSTKEGNETLPIHSPNLSSAEQSRKMRIANEFFQGSESARYGIIPAATFTAFRTVRAGWPRASRVNNTTKVCQATIRDFVSWLLAYLRKMRRKEKKRKKVALPKVTHLADTTASANSNRNDSSVEMHAVRREELFSKNATCVRHSKSKTDTRNNTKIVPITRISDGEIQTAFLKPDSIALPVFDVSARPPPTILPACLVPARVPRKPDRTRSGVFVKTHRMSGPVRFSSGHPQIGRLVLSVSPVPPGSSKVKTNAHALESKREPEPTDRPPIDPNPVSTAPKLTQPCHFASSQQNHGSIQLPELIHVPTPSLELPSSRKRGLESLEFSPSVSRNKKLKLEGGQSRPQSSSSQHKSKRRSEKRNFSRVPLHTQPDLVLESESRIQYTRDDKTAGAKAAHESFNAGPLPLSSASPSLPSADTIHQTPTDPPSPVLIPSSTPHLPLPLSYQAEDCIICPHCTFTNPLKSTYCLVCGTSWPPLPAPQSHTDGIMQPDTDPDFLYGDLMVGYRIGHSESYDDAEFLVTGGAGPVGTLDSNGSPLPISTLEHKKLLWEKTIMHRANWNRETERLERIAAAKLKGIAVPASQPYFDEDIEKNETGEYRRKFSAK